MEFSINHPILFVIAGILVAVVLAQSVFFLVKALRRSKELGMDQAKIRKTIVTASVFTIAPAVAIVISVITLSKKLEMPELTQQLELKLEREKRRKAKKLAGKSKANNTRRGK